MAVALWFTIGPWTVTTGGVPINCGRPSWDDTDPSQTQPPRKQWRATFKRQTGCTLLRLRGLPVSRSSVSEQPFASGQDGIRKHGGLVPDGVAKSRASHLPTALGAGGDGACRLARFAAEPLG
jgi:hypothetical protein